MTNMKIDIVRITDDGLGVGFDKNGTTVLIKGVKPDDESVKVEVVDVLETTIIAKKISGAKPVAEVVSDKKKTNPYQIDKGINERDDDGEDYYDD